jgi:hypothetical protein
MTEFACEKPCKYCTVTGSCKRLAEAQWQYQAQTPELAGQVVTMPAWRPGASGQEDAALKCGDTIPWPIIQAFGQQIHGQIWCSEHGWQPRLKKSDIEKARKAAAARKKKASDTFDDIAPF